jgi:hypothetical protein
MTFEVGAGPYLWLNELVAIGIGRWITKTELESDVYALA